MAKRYIKQLLSQKLGSYLDGLDSTDLKFSVSEAILQMENVRIKDDALTKLKLPIQIKHGQIRKLDLRVPWLKITSCPVEISLEGIDLLLAPLSSELWEVPDIFQPEYLTAVIEQMITKALDQQTTEQQQSYLDTVRLKILDNLKVKIKSIHVRMEHAPASQKISEIKQSSFGILLKSLELHTTDADGHEIFHDRTNTSKNIFKLLSIDGLAVYLNPFDATMIHKLQFKAVGKGNHIAQMMTKSIQQYILFTSTKEGDVPVGDDPNLIYILRPLSLKVQVERQAKHPQFLNAQITLDQFSIQVLYNQLKAILVFARLAQLYQKKYGEQEKVRKYRFLKQPTMNARQRWQFAIECIKRSIKTKKGALTAFNIPNKMLLLIEESFKPLFAMYYQFPESSRLDSVNNQWSEEQKNVFWHAIQSIPNQTLQTWVNQVIKQVNLTKKKQEPENQQQSWMGWLMSMGQQKDDEDDLDGFFDCDDGETVIDRNTIKQNTSLSIVFEVKDLTILVAKQNSQNRLDGMQMYNKAARFQLTSPNLNIDRFNFIFTCQESGVDLVSIDKTTSKYVECTATIKKNDHSSIPGMEYSPQLTLEVTKGDPQLAKQDIEYDINLQVISIVYKHYEDLIVRAWAISNIQVDEEISQVAKGTLEDLRETTQNRLHELLYKKRNRFVISVQSPVIILPVNGVFQKNPVWIIRTGDMLILSEDTRKLNNDLQAQQKIIRKISKRKESLQGELDEYEGYRFTLTSTALQYFHQYEIYEKFLTKSNANQQIKKQDSTMPPRQHDFTPQQNAHFNQRTPTHSIAQFSVLEDFEIQMLVRLKKKNKVKETNAAKFQVEISTSPIQINLSVTLYNLLLNLPKIFTISRQKREDFAKEIQDYNFMQREGIQRNAIIEGKVKKQNQRSLLWEDYYAVLSGKYVYLYKDKSSQELLESFDISNVDVQEQGSQILVSSQLDSNIKVTFRSTDGKQKMWAQSIEKRSFDLQIEEYQSTEQVATIIQKRKTIIKRKAQTLSAAQDCEQIQLKFTCRVPQLKVQIMRLVQMPGTKVFIKPLVYQEWVFFALIGMEMYRVSRELDSQLQIKFKQITLQNETMPFNCKTLVSQQQYSNNSGQNQIQTSLSITINSQKQNSPLFEGLLQEIDVELSNVNLKFMPDTINQLIKLLKSTKQQKNHSEDFICKEEFRLYYQNTDVVDEITSENNTNRSQQIFNESAEEHTQDENESIDSEAQQDQIDVAQNQKFYETTCAFDKTQTSKIAIKVTNIQMALLHHQYLMELYSLDSSCLSVVMCDWYDHSSFEVKMSNLLLSDLTNYPYTKSPKAYFDAINKNLQPESITPNELIKCNSFEMSLESYQSQRCPKKRPKFDSQLVMKISPFRINYVGEVTMRLIDYFQERFIATFVLADPYKNPKQEFEKLQKRKNIPSDRITTQTDFKQPKEITYMDITIQKAEIFAKDRPFSQSYILISSPTIKVHSELLIQQGRIFLKPDIALAVQRYKIEVQTLNFWFGATKKRRDRLSLLKKTFTVKIDFDSVAYSDLIDKIDLKTMDKSSHINIKIDPVMLILPQAVYTYILRCSDLNFAWTDRMQNEFYFIKWKHISEHYKQLKKVSAQKLRLEIQMLSLTLKHSDGSYISELLLSGFEFFMLKYMDGASNIDLRCNRFFILDQKEVNSTIQNGKHAIICPTFSPMIVNLETEMQDIANGQNQDDYREAQLQVYMKMRPNGRKSINVVIQGLKIFVKLPLFILLQNFFTQAFPQYNDDDVDKPVGFIGNDPDITGCMHLDVNINKSLICVLNRPGLKSLAFQGDIKFETQSENIAEVKKDFNQLSQKASVDLRNTAKSFVSQDKAKSLVVYQMLLQVTGLTPFICSLAYLDQGDVDFNSINKRQLHNPLNLIFEQKYILTPQLNDEQEETGKFGVTAQMVVNVEKLMLKLSILDLHLIMQAAAFMSEQMAEETVDRLRHIEQSIDKDFIQNQLQDDLIIEKEDVPPLEKTTIFSPLNAKQSLQKKSALNEVQKLEAETHKQEMFKGMLDRFRESNDDNMSTVMLRLSQTTSQFQKLSKGYTSQKYRERSSFLQFIQKDILEQDYEVDATVVQDEGPLQKFTGQTIGPMVEIDEASSESDNSQQNYEEQKATTQKDSSFNLMQKNLRTESLLGNGGQANNLYTSSSFKQKSKSPQNLNLYRPETAQQLSRFGGSITNQKSGTLSSRQVSRSTPKGSLKSGRITPSYRSANDLSDNEDDFQSARGSLESYQDAVEEALDVFYSFHEKRPLPKNDIDADTNDEEFKEVIVMPVKLEPDDLIKETDGEETQQSFSESLLISRKKTVKAVKAIEQKSSLENVLNDVKDVRCELISVLAINDFNSGFTPVLQLEMSQILMNQSWVPETTDTALELPALLVNYYNLELGEWEPLLERTQVTIQQMKSETENVLSINFKEPICFNSTEQCLKNLSYTYKSWMQTPQFFSNSKSNKNLANHETGSHLSDQRIKHSLNSDDEDDNQMNELQHRLIYNSIRESVLIKKTTPVQSQKRGRELMHQAIDLNLTEQYEDSPTKKNVSELVTPFSIVNYTTRTIKIVRGGIKIGTGQFSEVKAFNSQLPKDLTENEKIYVLAPRQQTDYAVTYDHLMGVQKTDNQQGQDQPPDLPHFEESQLDQQNNPRSSLQSQLEDEQQRDKLRRLKSKEIVGIQLSELDFVPSFDLNKNTGQNPWVHEISTFSNDPLVKDYVQIEREDLEQPLLAEEKKGDDYDIIPDTWQNRNIRNRVFYGTLIKDMRKFLIVRAPYCLVNKTSLNFEIKITETGNNQIKSKFRVLRGDIMGLDQRFYRNHSIQVRIAKDSHLSGGMGMENQEGWSDSVQISVLLNLQMDKGAGVYLTTFDGQSYCTCVKRQQGQLNGTTDLVLLPVITINNCLPSCIQIRPYLHKTAQRSTQVSEEPIKPLYTEIYSLEQSQEKQFYTFSPTKFKDDRQVIQIEVLVQGFDWALIELQVRNDATPEDSEFEISDLNGNSVRIGLRIQYIKAGFHLVFYAHACLLVESVLALPMMKICYKGRNFRQMKPLANSDELSFRKYLLCNKDSDVVVGIMDIVGQARPTYSFSPSLDIKQAGKQINFKIITQGSPEDDADTRYDFVCMPQLALAHYQESIYTKLVLISPMFVIVNKTKGYLRIAQHTAENMTAENEQIFTPGEKREWFWPNGELPDEQLKIIIKKIQSNQHDLYQNKKNKASRIEEQAKFDDFDRPRQVEGRMSESEKVLNWNWSAPISLTQEDQMSFPIVQCEEGGLRKKILIIGRKVVNSTTFITIREERSSDFPLYIIKNSCSNLRLGFSQDGQETIVPWHLEEMQQVSYAHVDPLALQRTVTFHLTIDKEVKRPKFKIQNCFERVVEKVDLDTEEVTLIDYNDLNGQPHQIQIKLLNDGQTKTLSFSPVGQKVLTHQEELQDQRKQQQQSQQLTNEIIYKRLIKLSINTFSISLIGYTKRNLYDQIERNYRPVRERNEIALFTIQGLQATQVSKHQDTEQEIRLVIEKFQVDNQSSQNPLFQTIFKKKNNSADVKFLTLDLKRYLSKDKNTSYIEFFKMELAKCTLKFDDEFLVNFTQAITAASQVNEDNSSGVHPLFMKENFYENFDKIDLYQSTKIDLDKQTDNRKSMTFVTAAMTDKSYRRQTIKPTQFGVYTIDELRCPQQGDKIPIAFRHWVMQDQIMEDSQKIYLKKFEIGTISFDLSFVFKTKKGGRQELTGPMNYLQSTGLTLVSIDEADFTLQSFKTSKKYLGQQDFIFELVVYFGKQALQEAQKLPFSVGVIGSPRNLLKFARIGITDFVDLPRRGFERNWYNGIGGVFLGTVSMFKNFSIGTFQFTQGVSHGFSNLCVLAVTDKDYAIKREDEHLTQKPQNFVEGVGYGAKSFLYSIYSAGWGIIERPIIETKRLKSFYGLGKGVWQATTGIIGKPLSGALDFFAKSSEGIKNTFRIFEKYDDKKGGRIRQPRTLYSLQRQIKTFSEDDAFMVSNVLCTIKGGAFANDHYIDMRLIRTANENQTPHFLLWTEENLFLIEATQKALVWHIESKNIVDVTNLNNGLMIYLDEKQDYAGRAQVGLPLDSKHQVDIRQWLDQIMNSNE